MEQTLSAPSTDRRVLDHAANEPESPKAGGSNYDRERERMSRAAASGDYDPVNLAIRREPTRAMFVAAGIGFVMALLVRW